jgi:hypothetical protein
MNEATHLTFDFRALVDSNPSQSSAKFARGVAININSNLIEQYKTC